MSPNESIAEISQRLAAGELSTTAAMREAFLAGCLYAGEGAIEIYKGLADNRPKDEPANPERAAHTPTTENP